ncbi:aminotransferase class I/II-fold pyridoxal phosphate-dependent enzyme [Candidatus Electronema sp. JM]|uniref:aminotransferase class I/II-fold pyridoxal phosphate-dependent enzyme n=1 Tax=Candidatus Electronema sp. JM TaxID=3401571 RepID=UPI003AA88F4C
MPTFLHLHEQLRLLDEQHLRRSLVPTEPLGAGKIAADSKTYLNLAGNDYLGLSGNTALLRDFYAGLAAGDVVAQYGLGSGASRLMTGSHRQYQELEDALARLYGTESALLFNSGWQLNTGLLPALARKEDIILADKLCHASLIDGLRLTSARHIRYPHLDYAALEHLLQRHCSPEKTVFIVTESIFSMDGDCADLRLLADLKDKYGAMLYVDEAHAVGVRGECGLGLAEEQGVLERIDLFIGTFGKAWGGQGAFVVCSRAVRDFLVNTARSFIFTTALPPVSIHWLNFVLPKITAMQEERKQLSCLAEQLRSGLRNKGLATGGESQIIPVLIGDAAQAVAAAARLREHGFWVNAVRPPTVPRNTARLRLSLTADIDWEQLAALPELIAAAVSS